MQYMFRFALLCSSVLIRIVSVLQNSSESVLPAIASMKMHWIKPAAKIAFGLKQKVLTLLLKKIMMEF